MKGILKMNCKECGGDMVGDGYTSVMYCENVYESVETDFMAPDEGPVYCSRIVSAGTPEEILARNLEQSIESFGVVIDALREGRLTIESGNFDLLYMYDGDAFSADVNVVGVKIKSDLKLKRV